MDKTVVKEDIRFNPGANRDSILALEKSQGFQVPDQLGQLWKNADGETTSSDGLFGGYRFLSIQECQETINNYFDILAYDKAFAALRYETSYMGKVKVFERGWLPLGELSIRELVICDVRVSTKTPVFMWSIESGPGNLLATSIEQFLKTLDENVVEDDYIGDL